MIKLTAPGGADLFVRAQPLGVDVGWDTVDHGAAFGVLSTC